MTDQRLVQHTLYHPGCATVTSPPLASAWTVNQSLAALAQENTLSLCVSTLTLSAITEYMLRFG